MTVLGGPPTATPSARPAQSVVRIPEPRRVSGARENQSSGTAAIRVRHEIDLSQTVHAFFLLACLGFDGNGGYGEARGSPPGSAGSLNCGTASFAGNVF